MADLLSSLVLPNSSQESFHSTYSTHSPTQSSSQVSQATLGTTTKATHPTNTYHSPGAGESADPRILTSESSSEAQSHPSVYEIDAYLNDPANKATLEKDPKQKLVPGLSNSPAKSSEAPPNGSSIQNPEPIQVGGPKSSHHVTMLFQMCQERALVPEFQIEEDPKGSQRFGGRLTVGGATVTLETSEASKKDARQALAAKACEVVRAMSSQKQSEDSTAGTENWVGKLLEFHSLTSTPTTPVPTFTEFTLGSSFACEVTIPQSPHPFGSRTTPHPSKKAAKAAAAHAAIAHLISIGHLQADGTIPPQHKASKRARLNPVPKAADTDESAQSWGQRVNALYPLLGLTAPEYRLRPDEGAANFYSGAAWFSGVGEVEGPVGEVRHVFGRKRAREESAKGVWVFLEGLRRKRLGGLEGEGGVGT